jgi:flagellar motility protein MotE (MotC chaperone)
MENGENDLKRKLDDLIGDGEIDGVPEMVQIVYFFNEKFVPEMKSTCDAYGRFIEAKKIELASENAKLESKRIELASENAKLESTRKEIEKETETQNTFMESNKKYFDDYGEKIQKMKEEVIEKNGSLMAFDHTIMERQDELKGLSNLLRASREDLIKSRSEIEKSDQELSVLLKAKTVLEMEIRTKNATLKRLNDQILSKTTKSYQAPVPTYNPVITSSSSFHPNISVVVSSPSCYAGALSAISSENPPLPQQQHQPLASDNNFHKEELLGISGENSQSISMDDNGGGLGLFEDRQDPDWDMPLLSPINYDN